jgi:hypothetical protein
MRPIAEPNLLLRVCAELPPGLKLATLKFREGWSFSRSVDVRRLEERIAHLGWNLVRINDRTLGSGVGDTAQLAIADALKLALRNVSKYIHAVEVERIQLTQYPWFFLARVMVCPYLIRPGADLPVHYDREPFLIVPRQQRPNHPHALYPHFGSVMPQLRQIMISSQESENRRLL